MSTTILIIGLILFFSHFLSLQFRRTNIPDVLILMLVGIVIGPLLGIVTPEDFGKIGSLIATIALVVAHRACRSDRRCRSARGDTGCSPTRSACKSGKTVLAGVDFRFSTH